MAMGYVWPRGHEWQGSVHGGVHAWQGVCGGGHVWQGCVHGRGHVWQGHVWQGTCMEGGIHCGGGHVWWWGGYAKLGLCMARSAWQDNVCGGGVCA